MNFKLKIMSLFCGKLALTFALILPFNGYAQVTEVEKQKIGYQGFVAGNLLQAAMNVEFVKSKCKAYIPQDAPILKENYEEKTYGLVKKYSTHPYVLQVTKEMRAKAVKNANFETLVIPGLDGPKEWCVAALYSNVTLFANISGFMKRTSDF